jgi:ferric-dicitrate binding protein FerR (iron transport regulator)
MEKPVMPLESLGQRVAEALDEHAVARRQAVERAGHRYLAVAVQRPARSRRVPFAIAAAFAGVVLGIGAFALVRSRPLVFTAAERPGVVETWVAAPEGRPVPLRFSDGTLLRLEPSSRARVVAVDAHGASLALESGSLHAEVVHSGQSAWRVIAGPLTVRVTGTRFDVRWSASAEEFSVAVTQGSVAISGAVVGEERAVRAGETLRVFVSEHRLEHANTAELAGAERAKAAATHPTPAPSVAELRAAPSLTPDEPKPSATPSPAPANAARAPDWRQFARKGSLREAFAAAHASGFEAACESASPSELLQLADGARLSGNPASARQPLLRLRSAFPGDSRRAAAAFTLGKIAFDQTRAYAEAAEWFATSIREQPGGSLAREAAGRLIEARRRSGDDAGARRAAEGYLARYPDGPHADLARSLVR